MQSGLQQMKKEVEGEFRSNGSEEDGVEVVLREVGQSESSAPTRLRSGGGSKTRKARKMKRDRMSSKMRMEMKGCYSVHDGQCSGAPPFVVPPMKFSIGK